MRYLIISEFLSANLGDQAIYRSTRSLLLGLGHEVEGIDLSLRKEIDVQRGGKKRIRFLNFIFLRYLVNLIRIPIKFILNYNMVLDAIAKADVVVIGGGALLMDNALSFPLRTYLFSRLSRYCKKPYLVFACSYRPTSNPLASYFISKVLKDADKVSMRDVESLRYCQEIHGLDPELVFDPAIYIQVSDYNSVKKIKRLAINVMAPQTHGIFKSKAIYKQYIEGINKILSKYCEDYSVVIFSTGDLADNRYIKETFSGTAELFFPDDLDSLVDFLASSERVVSTRLHSAILALSQNVVPLCISWDAKVNGFVDMLRGVIRLDIDMIGDFLNQGGEYFVNYHESKDFLSNLRLDAKSRAEKFLCEQL